jgi:hypothetical protein
MNTNPFTAKMWSHRFPAFCLGELVLMKPSCCWTVLYRYVCVCACCCIFIYILDLHNRLVTWNTLKYIKIHEPITILAMGTWGILGVILRLPGYNTQIYNCSKYELNSTARFAQRRCHHHRSRFPRHRHRLPPGPQEPEATGRWGWNPVNG